ncbi:D-3-phosphoglycerate dehydrogenase [Leucobacter exalbidus]|uniref:D-3-phosphoglycerate dehydrogenase n=1 Tax=Leucobacter exalbidus TaxID=662960 RepID=A0A940PNL2_9MICO|nr:NAD(P)-dependent oxidoreductase [Leucobacter exalbidus]MBP1326468.1 D-3-phosphoglycerate dehydrogenase [Leucobacter exalbidus]
MTAGVGSPGDQASALQPPAVLGPIVVGLGPVDPALVTPFLGEDVQFVSNPSPGDFAVAQGAIVRAAYDVDGPLLDRMPALRVVARTGVGVERVDVAEAEARGIVVATTPGSNARAVAEGAFAMLLSLVKRVPESHRYVAADEWGSGPVPVPGDAHGLTLAILGYGRIGRIVAGFATAFGMRVLIHDPFVQADDFENVSLAEAVARADALTLHLPGGDGELVPRELLATAKPGLVVVNCARAELISTATIVWGLESGQLGGVGLDVFESEPTHAHPLAHDPRVLLSPHTTGLSKAAMAATFQMAAEAVSKALPRS